MDGNFGNTIANTLQSRNRLENRGGEDNKVSGGMWEAVEAGTGEVKMEEAKGRGGKGGGWEKERRKGEEENEKGEDDGSKESGRGMGNIG